MKDDVIYRQAALDAIKNSEFGKEYEAVEQLLSAQPYTEEEIQAMQDLEQAQLDKAYELGWKDGREALRREIWEDGRDRLD